MKNKVNKLFKVIKVKILKEHIEKGKIGSGRFCPVALALKDLEYKNVGVCSSYGFLKEKSTYYNFDTPDKMSDFIVNFDFGREVKPTSFELELIKKTKNTVKR